jgi:flagellar biosynthesis repressor protein FlbT
MKNTLKISLKSGERIYLNGAVIRVDRKCSIELMNDVQFLLENHVLQADNASTPLRQLYFVLQVILMNPDDAAEARVMFRRSLFLLLATFSNEVVRAGLKQVDRLVSEGHVYEALKQIRGLYALEEEIMHPDRRAAASEEGQTLALMAGE